MTYRYGEQYKNINSNIYMKKFFDSFLRNEMMMNLGAWDYILDFIFDVYDKVSQKNFFTFLSIV